MKGQPGGGSGGLSMGGTLSRTRGGTGAKSCDEGSTGGLTAGAGIGAVVCGGGGGVGASKDTLCTAMNRTSSAVQVSAVDGTCDGGSGGVGRGGGADENGCDGGGEAVRGADDCVDEDSGDGGDAAGDLRLVAVRQESTRNIMP